MGAWGLGNFENDDAADYVDLVMDQDELEFLGHAFEAVLTDDPEAPDCSSALAAAEILCAACGAPAEEASEDLLEWVEGKNDVPAELIDQGLRAIAAVKTKSELRELWEDTEEFDEWIGVLEETESRLGDFS